ncbi:MAG: 2-amino-4-hydroxy-6-hydroxymethyldihydropteridine diphosphokinase [Methylococcaceae bacterium]|nr:2-amino-4-hydroxy-6-hydroxymethyldihydropteridine diphosphokinase [Methylococcaceae bacterium]MCI0666865.1 2-amino-4-hydroxy-6-hydroxymethyldihydropteridine diphosphokinase [Methylococcaceae bacterium]MCI0733738.1 2-amino-4-hydroxy-6-hydroxymethyldihydropteridine diphosphokinase [Methylococcaceae bacterium]
MSTGKAHGRETLVYIGLGSNLDNPGEQILRGMAAVAELNGCRFLARSGRYVSPPMGPQDQPDYVNAVMAIDCVLWPASLLDQLQAIEIRHGRVRSGVRWGARTLDLDILLYGQETIATADLIIPHPGIAERAFVLVPLAEIAPGLMIPGKGPIADLLERCPKDGLIRID